MAVVVLAGVGDAAGCGAAMPALRVKALQACSVDGVYGVVRVCCCRSGELAVDITGLV